MLAAGGQSHTPRLPFSIARGEGETL